MTVALHAGCEIACVHLLAVSVHYHVFNVLTCLHLHYDVFHQSIKNINQLIHPSINQSLLIQFSNPSFSSKTCLGSQAGFIYCILYTESVLLTIMQCTLFAAYNMLYHLIWSWFCVHHVCHLCRYMGSSSVELIKPHWNCSRFPVLSKPEVC